MKAVHQKIKVKCENCKEYFHPASLARHMKNACKQQNVAVAQNVHEFFISSDDPMLEVAEEIEVANQNEYLELFNSC